MLSIGGDDRLTVALFDRGISALLCICVFVMTIIKYFDILSVLFCLCLRNSLLSFQSAMSNYLNDLFSPSTGQ